MNILYNISNHPSSGWSPAQKQGWDSIVDVPFPNVDPSLSWDAVDGLADDVIADHLGTVMAFHSGDTDYPDDTRFCFQVQGDFTLSYCLARRLRRFGKLALPTSNRNTVVNPDGSKTVRFDFVAWRIDGANDLDYPKGVICNKARVPLLPAF